MDIMIELIRSVLLSAMIAGWLMILAGFAGFSALWVLALWMAQS